MGANGNGHGNGGGRVFTDEAAVRRRVPLLIGIMGPSGGGKTYSALRLATGIQRVSGGEIFVVDTESRRALHYADQFRFRHVPFGAPFSPSDYLGALEYCAGKGATTVIVDSMSHEHEGPGGVLEMHEAEIERLSQGKEDKVDKVKMLAWSRPKQERRRLINSILQLDLNLILCFRAKDKVKVIPGGKPESLGWMPIAGEEFLFELTVNFLLPPTARGVPEWKTASEEQRMFLKQPGQFDAILSRPRALDEDIGEEMARWAAGAPPNPVAELSDLLKKAGHTTGRARLTWCSDMLGRAIARAEDITADDLGVLIPKAREAAAAEAGI